MQTKAKEGRELYREVKPGPGRADSSQCDEGRPVGAETFQSPEIINF